MATFILPNHTYPIDPPTQDVNKDPSSNISVISYELLLCSFFPDLNEAICQVRDLATGVVRQALASNLLAFSYGKDAYLLELTSSIGRQE